MLYVGVDAHSKTSWITVMDEKGKILKREQISTSQKDVRRSLGRYRQPVKAVVEASLVVQIASEEVVPLVELSLVDSMEWLLAGLLMVVLLAAIDLKVEFKVSTIVQQLQD